MLVPSLSALAAPLTPEAAGRDLDAVIAAIETIHVDPFTVIDRDTFARRAEEVRASLATVSTDRDLWLRVAPLVAEIGDGHTYLLAPVFGGPDEPPIVRVAVDIDGDELFVTHVEGERLPEARRVATVDGRDATDLVRAMRAGFSGELTPFRDSWITETFHALYPWWADTRGPVHVTFAEGPDLTLAVRAGAADVETQDAGPADPWRWGLDGTVMVLDVDTFDLDAGAWTRDTREMFRAMRDQGATALVVDVRGNPGGNSGRIDDLVPHLTAPWRTYSSSVVRHRTRDGWAAEPRVHEFRPRNARASPTFDGPVYVLTDAATFSTAADLAVVLSDHDRAAIVGEPPGGAPTCTGNLTRVDLPSGMRLYVAAGLFVRADPTRGTGPLEVDLPAEPERALEVALAHARGGAP